MNVKLINEKKSILVPLVETYYIWIFLFIHTIKSKALMVLSKCAGWYFRLFIGKLESQCTDKKPFVIKSIDFFIRYISLIIVCMEGYSFLFWSCTKMFTLD